MNSIALTLARYLDPDVATLGTNLFAGRLPDAPDTAIGVRTYGGGAARFIHEMLAPSMETARVQVLTRAASLGDAEELADAAYMRLAALRNREDVWSVEPLESPFDAGRDENDRALVVFNVRASRRRS